MKILIIDGTNWAHRSYHAMARMQFAGRNVAAIWGFLNILAGNISKHNPDKIFVCWDHSVNPHRVKLLPGYKKREPKLGFDRDDFQSQLKYLRIMLKALGIPQLYAKYSEADDFIYCLVKKYKGKRKNKIIICSGDKDFRQLVSDRVLIQDENKGLISPLNFKKLFGIAPWQYSDYLSLMGDNSDKIPGVPGFGEVTTMKFLEDFGCVRSYLAQPERKHKKHDAIVKTYSINNRLINLEHFDTCYGPFPLIYYKGLKKPKDYLDKYLKLCKKFGIKKFITQKFLAQIP